MKEKLKLTKIGEEELNEKEMWEIKGGEGEDCTDTDGCAWHGGPTGSKYGTSVEKAQGGQSE